MRSVSLLVLSAAAACDPGAADPGDTLGPAASVAPLQRLSGQRLLTLYGQGLYRDGGTLDFSAFGLDPHEEAWIVQGDAEQSRARCPAALQGGCVDVASPRIVAQVRADAFGTYAFTVRAPPGLPRGSEAAFQVVTRQATSNVVTRHDPLDTGLMRAEFGIFGRLSRPPGELPSVTMVYGVRYRSERTGHDLCTVGWSVDGAVSPFTVPYCTDCDFSFREQGVSEELTDFGSDCWGVFGQDMGSPVRSRFALTYQTPRFLYVDLDPVAGQHEAWIAEAYSYFYYGPALVGPYDFDPDGRTGRFEAVTTSYLIPYAAGPLLPPTLPPGSP